MALKPLSLSKHARDAVEERKLLSEWLEATVREPDWTLVDPYRPGIERRFRAIPQYGGRVLRVACYETTSHIRMVTVFFDRKAKPAP